MRALLIVALAARVAAADGLSLEQIRSVMTANAKAFTGCYNRALKKNKNLHGPFLFDIVVDKAGKVTAARPFAPSALASFDTCIVDVLKRAKFPGGPATVEAPLVFDSQ